MNKRVLICGDSHSGHRAGLTPPGWQWHEDADAPRKAKWAVLQRECWKWFVREVSRLKPIDLLILMGDIIDGKGRRSGGTELIESDRNEQVDMALKWIRWIGAKEVRMIRGTPYHVGEEEDWEDDIARSLGCKIGDHDWYEEEKTGIVFDCKHHVVNSTIPHGRATPLLREQLWNLVWAEYEEQPRADILVRAHVHWYLGCDFVVNGRPKRVSTIPALQGMGTRFGARQMSSHVDFGLVHVDIDTKTGSYTWVPHLAELAAQKAHPLKF